MPTKIELEAEVARLRAKQEHIWNRFHELAEEHELCDLYDEAVTELDGPPRQKDYSILLMVSVRVKHTGNIPMDSWGTYETDDVLSALNIDGSLKSLQELLERPGTDTVDEFEVYEIEEV